MLEARGPGCGGIACPVGFLRNVVTRREGTTSCALDHDDPDVRIALRLLKRRRKLLGHLKADGVEALGSIQRDDRNALIEAEFDSLVCLRLHVLTR